MKLHAVANEIRTVFLVCAFLVFCNTTITAQKTCDCGDPPQGTVTCENTQEPFCIVRNGKVDARCESSRGKTGAALQRYLLEQAAGRSLTEEEWKNAELQAGLARGQVLVKDSKGYDVLVKMRSTSDFEKSPTFVPYPNPPYRPYPNENALEAFYYFGPDYHAKLIDPRWGTFGNLYGSSYWNGPSWSTARYAAPNRSFGSTGKVAPWWWDDSMFGLRCTMCVYRFFDGMICQSLSPKTRAEVKAETEKMCRGDFLCTKTQPTMTCR